MLRLHWAVSPVVKELVTYVLEHRQEIQTVLSSNVRVEDGILRGRLDALATVRARQLTGLKTTIVGHEPCRSYASGPNRVLGWVLGQAWMLASRFSTMSFDSPGYRDAIDETLERMEQSRRLQGVSQIISDPLAQKRPSGSALLEASRSRRVLYQKATLAYRNLLAIELGDPDAIGRMLKETLLGPLETWRRFELAMGYSVAEALADATGKRLSLNLLIGDERRIIASVGPFDLFWQATTLYHKPAPLEPSEVVTKDILSAFGFRPSSDRPDLVVVDRSKEQVVSIIEVKYLTGEDGSDRVRSAVAQLVRYARGYRALEECGPLLEKSIIALCHGIDGIIRAEPAALGTPLLVDFAAIKQKSFSSWAQSLSG